MVDAVLAFDLGTTHLKWVLVEEASGLRLWDGQADAHTITAETSSEQDPHEILAQVVQTLAQAQQYGTVTQVAFSSAMHSLVACDDEGHLFTKSWTWMDKRAHPTAASLRRSGAGRELRRLSGVPVHAMSPLVKWLHLRPQLPSQVRPVALKDYIIHHLTGQWATDYSTAAASGFLGLDGRWLPEALEMARLDAAQMPGLHRMRDRLTAREGAFEVVIGGSDGATAHWHLGVPPDGTVGVLAMGTSGALRTTISEPVEHPELFCYLMGPAAGYLVGSAFSNVGNVLAWLAQLFTVDIDTLVGEGIEAVRTGRPLPLALPYWFGERSPWWREDLAGAWIGMTSDHGRPALAGATLMAMAAGYAHSLGTLHASGASLQEIRGGSGLLDRPNMAQWMADALGHDIVLHDERDASLLGAVDLARNPDAERHSVERASGARYRPRSPEIQARVINTWLLIQRHMEREER